jgi:hypothetical protein
LAGNVQPEASDEELVAAAFAPVKMPDSTERATTWRQLLQEYLNRRKEILEIVTRHAACTKGGFKRVKILDAAQFVRPIKNLRANAWIPKGSTLELPGTGDLQKLYLVFLSSLRKAIDDEATHMEAWLVSTRAALGETPQMADVIASVTEALKACGDAGMGGAMIPQVGVAADALRDCDVPRTISAVTSSSKANDQLCALALLPHSDIAKISAFISVVEKALAASTQKIQAWLKDSLGGAGKQVLQVREQIEQDLTAMLSDLGSLSGGNGSANNNS